MNSGKELLNSWSSGKATSDFYMLSHLPSLFLLIFFFFFKAQFLFLVLGEGHCQKVSDELERLLHVTVGVILISTQKDEQ